MEGGPFCWCSVYLIGEQWVACGHTTFGSEERVSFPSESCKWLTQSRILVSLLYTQSTLNLLIFLFQHLTHFILGLLFCLWIMLLVAGLWTQRHWMNGWTYLSMYLIYTNVHILIYSSRSLHLDPQETCHWHFIFCLFVFHLQKK